MVRDTATLEQIEEALQRARWFTEEEYPEVIYLGNPSNKRQGRRIRRSCPNCDRIYYLRPCDVVRRKYCSNECARETQRAEAIARRLVAKCPICGKEMRFSPSAKRKFCSRECLKLADRRKPNSDKRRFRCSKTWRRIRRERLFDFGNVCPITLENHQLEVHHIDEDWSNNESES